MKHEVRSYCMGNHLCPSNLKVRNDVYCKWYCWSEQKKLFVFAVQQPFHTVLWELGLPCSYFSFVNLIIICIFLMVPHINTFKVRKSIGISYICCWYDYQVNAIGQWKCSLEQMCCLLGENDLIWLVSIQEVFVCFSWCRSSLVKVLRVQGHNVNTSGNNRKCLPKETITV